MQEDKVKRKFLFIAGPITLFIILVGFTYAFFNYTRTGTANTISTGQINFLTTQSNTLSLTNVFPIASSEVSNANLDEVEIRIQGDTTYTGGEEFEIAIEGVNNTIGTSPNEKTIPINFVARYVPTASGDIIGSAAVSDYFAERGSTTTVYQLTETGIAENGKQILVGYIPANGEIDGTLKVSAYIDSSNIAISDTYYENVTTTPTPSAPNDEYGTTTEWVDGRTVLTTSEWNDLQNSQEPLSFKIKAVSQEGTWVEEPPRAPTMQEMCPDCVFAYNATTDFWTVWNTENVTPSVLTSSDYSNNYEDVIAETGRNFFIGLKLNGSYQIEKAYACGIYNDTIPFCIEGTSDGAKYESNKTILQNEFLWNDTCQFNIPETIDDNNIDCGASALGLIRAFTNSSGYAQTGDAVFDDLYCNINNNGNVLCP